MIQSVRMILRGSADDENPDCLQSVHAHNDRWWRAMRVPERTDHNLVNAVDDGDGEEGREVQRMIRWAHCGVQRT